MLLGGTRRRWQPFLSATCCHAAPATNPGDRCETHQPLLAQERAAPIRSCSGWGLPCRDHCWPRGALLPHPFTLTAPQAGVGGFLSVALSLDWVAPARRALPATLVSWSPDFPRYPKVARLPGSPAHLLPSLSLVTIQEQSEQDRRTLAVNHFVDGFGTPPPLEGAHSRQPIGDVIAEAFKRQIEGPVIAIG